MESLPAEVTIPKQLRKYAPRGRTPNPQGRFHGEDPYLHRQFIAWDGEGKTLPDGSHIYTLMCNSMGQHIQGTVRKPLTTRACVRFLLDGVKKAPSSAIHVIFGGSYDTNMLLGSLSRSEIEAIHHNDWVTTRGLRIGYRQGKSLNIKDLKTGNGIMLYDVISFFQCSFVKACDAYLGTDWENRETIIAMKQARGDFINVDDTDILEYSFSEVRTLVRLMEELRRRLWRAGMKISRWDGPGSVAATLLRNRGVSEHKGTLPKEAARAARYAYAGGRFELIKCGHVEDKVYEYDINSAYPYGLSMVPSLAKGIWSRHETPKEIRDFSLTKVNWNLRDRNLLLPACLPVRGIDGSVWFPFQGAGWYWGIEAKAAQKLATKLGGKFEVTEVWEFEPAKGMDIKPFGWIPEMYEQRRRLKARGDGAHVGMKLGLNSLYGKTAQQIGWKMTSKGLRVPPFHQIEWAGFTTASCRAKILEAIALNPSAIVAIETDAIFSTEPLPLPVSDDLGDWEETIFDNLTYVQSGFYFGSVDGKEIAKYRGFDPGTVSRSSVLRAMERGEKLQSHTTRFIGMGAALATDFTKWRRWERQKRELTPYPTGKREHSLCTVCQGRGFALGVWHDTHCPMAFIFQESREYPIGWINPNAAMKILDELRLEGYGQWDVEVI